MLHTHLQQHFKNAFNEKDKLRRAFLGCNHSSFVLYLYELASAARVQ